MEQILLNNALQLSGLEQFRLMTDEETAGFRLGQSTDTVSITSPELHLLISAGWRKEGGFFSRLMGGNDYVGNMEKCYRRVFKPYGFRMDSRPGRQIAGEMAQGVRYTYRAKETDMTGESFVLKKDDTLYYLHAYYRTSQREESLKRWNAILDTAVWKERDKEPEA